jgi:hypothetical protein
MHGRRTAIRAAVASSLLISWEAAGEEQTPPPPDAQQWQMPHYDDGFVLVSTPDPSANPFRLRLKHVLSVQVHEQ